MPFLLDFGLYMSFMTSAGIKDTKLPVFATWPRAPSSARGVLSRAELGRQPPPRHSMMRSGQSEVGALAWSTLGRPETGMTDMTDPEPQHSVAYG